MNNTTEKFIEAIEINIKIIDTGFNEEGNFTELYFQASLIEVVLKYLFIHKLKNNKKYDSNMEKYIDNLGLFNLINDCFIQEIINKKMHDKLENYRKQRNILVHKMFLDEKYFKKLNFSRMQNLGKEILEDLILIIKDY